MFKFTKIQSLSTQPNLVTIPAWETRIFLSDGNERWDQKKKIILSENAECRIYGFFPSGSHSIDIVHEWKGSRSFVGCTLFSAESMVEMKILSTIGASDSTSDIRVLSLAGTGWNAVIDGSILIEEGVTKAEWSVNERHVFLGSSGKIRGIPALLVHSDDVKAQHSLAIERISDEEMFYLRSRGFSRDEATIVMLESSIIDVFSSFGNRFPDECRRIVGEIMGHIHGAIAK